MNRVLIFIVAYNAERTLVNVIRRIPKPLLGRYEVEILIIDDASTDGTFEVGTKVTSPLKCIKVTVLKNPANQGYGGNQKLGYEYAIRNGFDYVVLLHGDGQYAPEEIPRLLHHLVTTRSAAVFGSRMMEAKSARKGGMPAYKYLGNRILTLLQNRISGLRLSEWHSGYRLYSIDALRKVPFDRNSDDFDFDTQIILQLQIAGYRIEELPIPTFYGDEVCHVNGLKYAFQIMKATLCSRLSRLGIFHDPVYDEPSDRSMYRAKFGYPSSHQIAFDSVKPHERVLALGCGPIETIAPFNQRTKSLFLQDLNITEQHRALCEDAIESDLNDIEELQLGANPFDCVLLLDVIEHLQDPEAFLARLRRFRQLRNARFIFTTPNVVFFPLRIMFAVGQFNYGTRGILDRTHTRLFTCRSFRRILMQQGFRVTKKAGIPAPYPLAVGPGKIGKFLVQLNSLAIKLSPSLFAYQIYCEATPIPTVGNLLSETESHSESLRELIAS